MEKIAGETTQKWTSVSVLSTMAGTSKLTSSPLSQNGSAPPKAPLLQRGVSREKSEQKVGPTSDEDQIDRSRSTESVHCDKRSAINQLISLGRRDHDQNLVNRQIRSINQFDRSIRGYIHKKMISPTINGQIDQR